MTVETWDDLPFWSSGEWQVIQERLEDLKKAKVVYNPSAELMFSALDQCPLDKTVLMIMGQDPYPDHEFATGLAFSIPKRFTKYPVTLQNIFREYQEDLGYRTSPSSGDLSSWASQGVLLWNAIPSCEEGKPGSHKHWFEWDDLTKQIVETLSKKGVVFGLLGSFARKYASFIDEEGNEIVETSHPSPRGNLNSNTPFNGSRFFSTCNDRLCKLGLTSIEWKLP